MKSRVIHLVLGCVLSGCTAQSLVRDNLLPECPGEARRATSRAAGCMTSALYEIALKNDKASHAVSPVHDDHVESKGEAADQAAANSSP